MTQHLVFSKFRAVSKKSLEKPRNIFRLDRRYCFPRETRLKYFGTSNILFEKLTPHRVIEVH